MSQNIHIFSAQKWLRNTLHWRLYWFAVDFNFNLLFGILHCAYNQISDYEIYTALTTSIVAKYIVLSNIISVASDRNPSWY